MSENLSKYIKSESQELLRSQLHFADYNPRTISDESRKTLKRGIKKFGLAGGLVVNKRTDYTVVSGHQRLSVLDELQKYNAETHENDYTLRVDVVDVDEAGEQELNILLNNPNAQGQWDFDALSAILPNIDYRNAGLTEADLSMIGVDYLYQTDGIMDTTSELADLMQPTLDLREQKNLKRKAEREALKAEMQQTADDELFSEEGVPVDAETDYQNRTNHMKDVKRQVREAAMEKAQNLDAYVTLSFDTFQAKAEFMRFMGYGDYDRFIKGEDFMNRLEFDDAEETNADGRINNGIRDAVRPSE